jgi:hypothetical protein
MSKKILLGDKAYVLYGWGEDHLKNEPHMIEEATGRIPSGKQLPMLKTFLRSKGVALASLNNKNTHWCVLQAISWSDGVGEDPLPETKQIVPGNAKSLMLLDLTPVNVESIENEVRHDEVYGSEEDLINRIFSKYPNNDNLDMVALKICLIDVTNSTQLSKQKRFISLPKLAEIILSIKDIDRRIQRGDPTVVNDIARTNGKIELFSFATKFCCYHNHFSYGRDDYSICDTFVEKGLPNYAKWITSGAIKKWKKEFDYESFNDCIEKVLSDGKICIADKRRKFDHFLWWQMKKKSQNDQKLKRARKTRQGRVIDGAILKSTDSVSEKEKEL